MNAAFFLADTNISATARMTMTLADALAGLGWRVRIVTTGMPVTWRSSRAEWVYVDERREFVEETIEASEVVALGPIVEDELYRARIPRENDPLRVLFCGAWQNETHHTADGYGAVAHARWFHQTFELVRASPWAPSREEPLEAVQEFHVALTTVEMTRLMHSCDVLLAPAPSISLTTAEALASGLACAGAAPLGDAALHAPPDNAIELGERLIELLADPSLRNRLRVRGREVAQEWRVEKALEKFVAGR